MLLTFNVTSTRGNNCRQLQPTKATTTIPMNTTTTATSRITTTRGRTTITTAKHAKKPRKIGKLQYENKPHEPQAGRQKRERRE